MNTTDEIHGAPQLVAPPPDAPTSFDTDLCALVRDLQRWRADCAAEPPPDDDFPPLDIRALLQGAAFLAAHFILQTFALPQGRPVLANSPIWLAIVAGTLLLSFGYGIFLVAVKAHGMHQVRFWRALRPSKEGKDPFPFEPMHGMLERDLRATRRLEPYSLSVLHAAKERFTLIEETLRVRLNGFFGNPSLLVLSGLLGAIWTAWERYSASGGTFTLLLLTGSIGVFVLGLYGAKLQISLADLTRCRALLTLEIARRSAGM
jgi:hypothetical protein